MEENVGRIPADGLRLAIVVAKWNSFVTDGLLDGAMKALREAGGDESAIEIFRVPGAFEIPLVCQHAATSGSYDGVIALGAVIRGETPHFEYVCRAVTDGVSQAALGSGVPVTFGVLTTDTAEHAIARSRDDANNKGGEAAMAALEMIHLLKNIPRQG